MRKILYILIPIVLHGCTDWRIERLNKASEKHFHNGNCQKAMNLVNKSIRINDINPVAYNNRASYNLCLGEMDAILADLDKAIQIAPKYYKAYVNRANYYYRINEYEKSINDLKFAISVNYDLRRTLLLMILATRDAEKDTETIEYCNRLIDKYSDSIAYYHRAVAYKDLNHIEKAYEDIKVYKKYDSASIKFHILLGKLKNKENKHLEAIKEYKKCLKIDSNHSYAYYNLGYSFAELDMFDSAYVYTQLALQFDTTNLIYYQLGRAEEFRENYNEAIYYLTKALQIDSLDSKSYFARGMNYGLIENYQKLYEDLEIAFDLGYYSEKYNIDWWESRKIELINDYNIETK